MSEKRYTLKAPTTVSSSKLDLERALNDSQRNAVESDAERMLILAGAGSGKTRTLTYRVARLIEKGAPPEGVILVTFTHRAAREMISRIDSLLGPAARRVRAGTFHALAHQTLRRHAAELGYRPGFGIIDREDQAALMSAALADIDVDVTARRFPSGEALVSLLSLAINTEQRVADVIARRFPRFAPLEKEIESVLRAYTVRKVDMNVMDFDDLLLNWKALLSRGDGLAHRLRSEARHVLVDEFQDTNKLQADIAELLASEFRSLCVVGDDAQSIYAFRGARFENILDFPRAAKTDVHRLTLNYRSTPEILTFANEIIRRNALQFPKDLVAKRARGCLPVVVPARDAAQQGEFIAQRILELRDEGIPLGAQAVLYRAHSHGVELQVELARRDIPFVLRSGVRFFEQAHVKDAVAFLRIVANPFDELAWQRVLGIVPGIGSRIARRLFAGVRDAARAGADPFLHLELHAREGVRIPARAERPFTSLATTLRTLAGEGLRRAPGEMIRVLLTDGDAPLVDHLHATYLNGPHRVQELLQLADIAAQHDGLDAFLSEIALVNQLSGEDPAGSSGDRELLAVSTVHQAKGLEWRVVFIAGLSDGGFPNVTALDEEGGEEEERRLFYVAVTRAMEQLYLCYPASRTIRNGDRVLDRPSRFLSELSSVPDLFEKWLLDTTGVS